MRPYAAVGMALVMYRAKDGAKFSIGGGLVMGMGGDVLL